MKELHLLTSKSIEKPAFHYIQIKNNVVNVTNGFGLITLPVIEVFGKDCIEDNEELYFLGTDWKSSKIYKAANLRREGLTFFAMDSNFKSLGFLIAKNAKEINTEYPDFSSVLLDESNPIATEKLAFNTKLLLDVCTAFGCGLEYFYYTFFGTDKPIIVRNKDSKGIGLIQHCLIEHALPVEEIDPEIQDLL